MSDGAEVEVYRSPAPGRAPRRPPPAARDLRPADHIREQCDQYAADGYEVLAPALFDREAPGLRATYSAEDIARTVRIAREEHPFALSVADAQAGIDQLRDAGPVFAAGYCYGDSLAWAAACRCAGLTAAAAYYGSLIPGLTQETPACPTILHFGLEDAGIQPVALRPLSERHPICRSTSIRRSTASTRIAARTTSP